MNTTVEEDASGWQGFTSQNTWTSSNNGKHFAFGLACLSACSLTASISQSHQKLAHSGCRLLMWSALLAPKLRSTSPVSFIIRSRSTSKGSADLNFRVWGSVILQVYSESDGRVVKFKKAFILVHFSGARFRGGVLGAKALASGCNSTEVTRMVSNKRSGGNMLGSRISEIRAPSLYMFRGQGQLER